MIEKPYGHDERTAHQLDVIVHAGFDESQVFRIDHYLGKDTVQNVLALRFANAIFQPIWNRTWVDQVQITVGETLGVGSRGSFYEKAGATRDILQNHVLQVLALALMEPPASFDAEAVRNEKVKLLQSIRLPTTRDIDRIAVRGQYSRGGTAEELMPGYREEPGVDPRSRTETFAALRLDVDNWRWAGVPFYVRTGKRLPRRVTEVVLQFQRPPHLPIGAHQVRGLEPDGGAPCSWCESVAETASASRLVWLPASTSWPRSSTRMVSASGAAVRTWVMRMVVRPLTSARRGGQERVDDAGVESCRVLVEQEDRGCCAAGRG